MPISTRREHPDIIMKHSPVESIRELPESPEPLLQNTGIKVRKVCIYTLYYWFKKYRQLS